LSGVTTSLLEEAASDRLAAVNKPPGRVVSHRSPTGEFSERRFAASDSSADTTSDRCLEGEEGRDEERFSVEEISERFPGGEAGNDRFSVDEMVDRLPEGEPAARLPASRGARRMFRAGEETDVSFSLREDEAEGFLGVEASPGVFFGGLAAAETSSSDAGCRRVSTGEAARNAVAEELSIKEDIAVVRFSAGEARDTGLPGGVSARSGESDSVKPSGCEDAASGAGEAAAETSRAGDADDRAGEATAETSLAGDADDRAGEAAAETSLAGDADDRAGEATAEASLAGDADDRAGNAAAETSLAGDAVEGAGEAAAGRPSSGEVAVESFLAAEEPFGNFSGRETALESFFIDDAAAFPRTATDCTLLREPDGSFLGEGTADRPTAYLARTGRPGDDNTRSSFLFLIFRALLPGEPPKLVSLTGDPVTEKIWYIIISVADPDLEASPVA
jgi:hypothetical protein